MKTLLHSQTVNGAQGHIVFDTAQCVICNKRLLCVVMS